VATSFRVAQSTSTRPSRLLLYSRAALFAVIAAFTISVVSATGADTVSGRLGGDFPAFYAAGSIVADGDWAELYAADRQREAQAALFPEADGSYLYFAYPPHVAPLYRPLAALDYRAAYAVHTIVMVAALMVALSLIRPMVAVVRDNFELVVTASLLFYPMLRAITGGQNTALSLLAIAATWRLLFNHQDVSAGFVLALLLYKPQLAIPLIGLLLIARRWRAVGAAGVGAAAVWAFGAVAMGTNWVSIWWSEVSGFAAADADVNGQNAVSWLGFAEAVAGAASPAARAIALPLMAATGLALIWVWRRPEFGLNIQIAAASLGIVMMSPHAMFYDAGLLVLAGIVVIDRLGPRACLPIALGWAAAWLQIGAGGFGVAPLFFVIVAIAVWAVPRMAARQQSPSAALAVAP
jgi:hypothetical protein